MIDKKIGFLGGGAMAEAMVSGILDSRAAAADNISVCDHKKVRCEFLKEKYGIDADVSFEAMLKNKDIIFLAVKPQVFAAAAAEVKTVIEPDTLIVSILAGITLAQLEAQFPDNPVIRVMPNTPMAVGEGMSGAAGGSKCSDENMAVVVTLLESCGKVVVVKENLMDAVSGVSGCGPAYAFVIIDAMSDAGVEAGLKRADAVKLAAQTLLGAAKMVLETGRHPAELRDMVTSPGGSTIAGIRVMEQQGVRGAMIDTVAAAVAKSKAMGKK